MTNEISKTTASNKIGFTSFITSNAITGVMWLEQVITVIPLIQSSGMGTYMEFNVIQKRAILMELEYCKTFLRFKTHAISQNYTLPPDSW